MKKIIIAAIVTIFTTGAFAQTMTPSKMGDSKMETKMSDKKMAKNKKMMDKKKMDDDKKMIDDKKMMGDKKKMMMHKKKNHTMVKSKAKM